MIRTRQRPGAGAIRQGEPPHLFSVGQAVRLVTPYGMSRPSVEIFKVTAKRPARDNCPQYLIRNEDERHERMASQDDLEPAGILPISSNDALIERTFSNGQGTKAQQSRATETETGEEASQA